MAEADRSDIGQSQGDGLGVILDRKRIHTDISKETYNKLLLLGSGRVNAGIEKAIRIVEMRELDVKTILQEIATEAMKRAEALS